MAEEVARHRLGVRRDVEDFVVRDAGVGARGDVADGVAARLARGHAHVGQVAHRQLRVLQQHEVVLDVLPGGDVAEAARIPGRNVGKRAHLRPGDDPLRDLDAHHLHAVLPLAVGAAQQAETPPVVGRDLAVLVPAQRLDELVDVALPRERPAVAPDRPLCFTCYGHNSPR